MYASVYDAAVTVGMALTNVIAGSDDRTQISLTRVSNATCALRRASTQHKGPGWKLLQHIREVPFHSQLSLRWISLGQELSVRQQTTGVQKGRDKL